MNVSGALYCIGCGLEGDAHVDRFGRPYWSCHSCGLVMFMRTKASESGFIVMQNIIRKNPRRYRKLVLAYTGKRIRYTKTKFPGRKVVKVDPFAIPITIKDKPGRSYPVAPP